MSETTKKNQDGDNDITKTADKSTWDLAIKHIREELNYCISLVPLGKVDPDKILVLSNRLKTLDCTLDKLKAVYCELLELRETVSKNPDKE